MPPWHWFHEWPVIQPRWMHDSHSQRIAAHPLSALQSMINMIMNRKKIPSIIIGLIPCASLASELLFTHVIYFHFQIQFHSPCMGWQNGWSKKQPSNAILYPGLHDAGIPFEQLMPHPLRRSPFRRHIQRMILAWGPPSLFPCPLRLLLV